MLRSLLPAKPAEMRAFYSGADTIGPLKLVKE